MPFQNFNNEVFNRNMGPGIKYQSEPQRPKSSNSELRHTAPKQLKHMYPDGLPQGTQWQDAYICIGCNMFRILVAAYHLIHNQGMHAELSLCSAVLC